MHKKTTFFILPFFGFFVGYTIVWYNSQPSSLMCPSLIGMSLLDAALRITESKLYIRVIATRFDNDLPEGTVIQQIPQAGACIKQNQPIYLSITLHEYTYIPQLQGLLYTDALCKEAQKNFTLIPHYLPSAYPSGTIIAQTPCAGEQIKTNTIIVYVSHTCSSLYLFPLLEGRTIKEMQEFCNRYGFSYSIQPTPYKEDALITAQEPKAGAIVQQQKIKTVYVACT